MNGIDKRATGRHLVVGYVGTLEGKKDGLHVDAGFARVRYIL
jgi:hypothetical protein